MTMLLHNRIGDFNGLQSEMERFLNGCATAPRETVQPNPVRYGQDENNVYVELIAPGLSSDGFQVQMEENVLSIKAKMAESKEDDIKWQQKCYCVDEVDQKIKVRQPVEQDKITAQYTQGVLRVTLPLAPSSKPQRIAVN